MSAYVSSSAIQHVCRFIGTKQSRYAASWCASSALPDGGFQIALSMYRRMPGSPASFAANSALRAASVVAAIVRSAFHRLQSCRVLSGGVTPGV